MAAGTKTCRHCGEPIPPGALGGNCPRCLAALALSTRLEGGAPAPSGALALGRPALQRFFGDYEILGELARGGMGVVFRARQVSLNRLVALKMIAAGQLATPAQVQRFHLEAEAAARLDHPNIVPIYEVGEHQGQHFYSMKLVEGGTLARGAAADGSLNEFAPRESAVLVFKIAQAVYYAHQRGILHRDLKPTNILIDTEGEPHITDFGLAKLMEEDAVLTQDAAILGTPAYMAPELASGQAAEATTAADVYALGAMLYELLAGQPPFADENLQGLLRKIIEDEPVPPSQVACGPTVASFRRQQAERGIGQRGSAKARTPHPIDRDLEIICLKCLEKDPARRYTSARTLADDLEHWLAGEPILARPAGALEKFGGWCRRKPALAALWGALAVALLAGVTGIVWQWRRAEASANEARRASAIAREQLWKAQLAQAHAQRLTGVAGRKEASFAAVQSATAIRPSMELRDEAIAALALTDVAEQGSWQSAPINDFEQPVFSPDLDRYALGRRRGDVSVFRMDTGARVAQFQGPPSSAVMLRFSPDGQSLAAHFGNGDASVWSLTNGVRLLNTNVGVRGRNQLSLDFSPDQSVLALASGTNGVRLLSLANGAEVKRLPLEGESSRVRFRPDGRALAVSSASNLVLWSLVESRAMQVLPHPGEVNWFAWHPDGLRLAVAFAGSLDVWLWDTASTNCLVLKGHLELVSKVAFNHHGDLLMSTAYDGTTRFWKAGSGELLFVSRAGFGSQFSPDDTRVGFVREGQGVGVWKLNPSTIYRELTPSLGAPRRVVGFDFSPDGRWIAAANVEGVQLCDLQTGQLLAAASHRNNHSVWFTAEGKRVVLVGRDHLHQWNVIQGHPSRELQDQGRLEFQPRPSLDAGSATRGPRPVLTVPSVDQVFCVDLKTPERWWTLPGNGLMRYVNSAAASPDTNWIATTYWKGGGTFIWDTRTRQRVHNFGAEGGFVTFSPDSRYLLVGSAHRYALWEVGTWRQTWDVPRRSAGELVGPGAFSPDGKMIALCPEVNLLQLVETDTGRKIASLDAPVPKNIGPLAFSPDGGTLAASTFGSEIQLWDLRAIHLELARLNLDW